MFSWFKNRNTFSSTEGKEDDIIDKVRKGQKVTVTPTSSRYYYRGTDTTYQSGSYSIDNTGVGTRVGRPSSAIDNATYDPKTHKLLITFKGNSKEYEFQCPVSVFIDFLNASSKGRYVNEVLRRHYTV